MTHELPENNIVIAYQAGRRDGLAGVYNPPQWITAPRNASSLYLTAYQRGHAEAEDRCNER